MRHLATKTALIAAVLVALASPASATPPNGPELPPTQIDPCVYGYPEDPGFYADGTPAPTLPYCDDTLIGN